MEDVIQTYRLPYDPRYPVVCFDEACKQLFGEVRPPRRARRGKPTRVDYEYERKGVCHRLLMCEPLRGWRHVEVTERRTRRDYARCVRDLVDRYYPRARMIRLVQDNLNTHDGASLYEAFAPEQARRLLDWIEFHYTPKHGSWLNSVMDAEFPQRSGRNIALVSASDLPSSLFASRDQARLAAPSVPRRKPPLRRWRTTPSRPPRFHTHALQAQVDAPVVENRRAPALDRADPRSPLSVLR